MTPDDNAATFDENPATADTHASVYDGLLGENEGHWAFGTFDLNAHSDDPLAGVETAVPEGMDPEALATYCLMLGDDALIMSQQLAKWTAKAPDLEEDVALSNIALDLLGQARLLLARAAAADPRVVPTMPEGSPVPADDALAYFRDADGFRNVRLVEADNGDFAGTQIRLFLFTLWRLAIFGRLIDSADRVLAAVAAKGVKEMTYHRDYSARWIVTLAQGTAESRRRTIAGFEVHWPFIDELFNTHRIEKAVGVDPATVRDEFDAVLGQVLAASGLDNRRLSSPEGRGAYRDQESNPGRTSPAGRVFARDEQMYRDQESNPGRDGIHTEAMGPLLAELQSVARQHPMGSW